MITFDQRCCALRDPAYHRYLMFGMVDRIRSQMMGRELEPHEKQSELSPPQLQVIKRCEQAIADRTGDVIVIRQARQTGKNEEEAMIETRALSVFKSISGSIYVRTAPTKIPQIINSKLRLEKHLTVDPLLVGQWGKREGFIYELRGAQIHFLSGARRANVVGATASIALSADEAHKLDKGKFQEDFSPFTARTNAPTFLWGVGAARQDMLFEYRSKLDGTDCVMEYPADIWCELSSAYASHYESQIRLLGADHPVIATQYDLLDIEAIGAYLSDKQRESLFAGEHPRMLSPRPGMSYGIVCDVGGESETGSDGAQVREAQPGRDSTFLHVLEWDEDAEVDDAEPYPMVRVVNSYWKTGANHMDLAPEIVRICRHYHVGSGVIDARGVGEAVAFEVARNVPQVVSYMASDKEVSTDCYDLLARLNTNRVRFWRADPASDKELGEMQAQSRHTKYRIQSHDRMQLVKPTGTGTSRLHIDGIKALTYLHRAAQPQQPIID